MELTTSRRFSKVAIAAITGVISIVFYIGYLISISNNNENRNYSAMVFFMNWIGIMMFFYVMYTWYKITKTILSPYTIFMLFFFLFNFGQCFMWAFGIHDTSEIGKNVMYNSFGVATELDIFKAQILTLICIIMFHFGAVLCCKRYSRIIINTNIRDENIKKEDTKTLKAIYYSSLMVGCIVIPVTLYNAFQDLKIARNYGYSALYYSEFAQQGGTVSGLLVMLFFPCLIGLLIGSKYNKKVTKVVYIIFGVYLIINLLCGDRSSWIFRIFILAWLSHSCNKKIDIRKFIKYLIIAIIGLHITNVIVEFRNIGLSNISFENIFSNSPIVSGMFEMGGSMQPTIILQKYGWNIWPFENSYLLAILGAITNKIISFLGIPFELLSTWFSQYYLGISWGAGFSLVAEALLNFGPILAPLIICLQGNIIASILYVDKSIDYLVKPLRYLFTASTLDCFIRLTRNEIHLILKQWFYGVILFYIFIILVRKVLIKNTIKVKT